MKTEIEFLLHLQELLLNKPYFLKADIHAAINTRLNELEDEEVNNNKKK